MKRRRQGEVELSKVIFTVGAVIGGALLVAWALGGFDHLFEVIRTEVNP